MLHVSIPKESSSGSSYKTIYTPVLQFLKVFYELLDDDSLGIATSSILVNSCVWLMCFIFIFMQTLQHYGITQKKFMGWPLPVPVLEGPCAFSSLFLLNNLGMLTHLGIKTFF
jgi:hypothetical protein